MARQVSNAELWRQIEREGRRWDLHPMISSWGDVLVGEDIPIKITLPCGLGLVERLRRDITAVSMDYPWSSLLRNRKQRGERVAHARLEVATAAYVNQVEQRKADMFHELAADIRKADRQRIVIPSIRMPR